MNKPLSYPKNKINILLTEGIHRSAEETFRKAGYTNVKRISRALSEEELLESIEDLHILGIRSKTQIHPRHLAKAKKLLAIGCFCIGTNQVDLAAALERGIVVFNSPYSNTRSVAELVIAEAIMLMRKIPDKDKAAHQGIWLKDASGSHEIRGKTIGIIGYGHIGSQVSVLAEALGMKVIYYDIEPKLPLGNATAKESLDEVLSMAHIVTLHVPADETTHMMINRETLACMREGAILLNLSRGSVVDIEALAEALRAGKLSGAGIDVFPEEPSSKGEPFQSPLQGLPNVILTPHIGGSTVEAQENIGYDVAGKLIQFLDIGSTVGSHTVPPLNLPPQKDTHRILHIHYNKPGVLSEINQILSSEGINITAQYLKTNETIGYVVLDVEATTTKTTLNKLKKVRYTIRTRILY